jgi:hypothetical protein
MNENIPNIVAFGVCSVDRITELWKELEVKSLFDDSASLTCFAFVLLTAAKSKHLNVCTQGVFQTSKDLISMTRHADLLLAAFYLVLSCNKGSTLEPRQCVPPTDLSRRKFQKN